MIDKKNFVLTVVVSWVLTLVTVLLISNFLPSLTQPFTQQVTESNSFKVIALEEKDVMAISQESYTTIAFLHGLYHNFTWTPSNPRNNAIYGILCSFEYVCDNPNSTLYEKTDILRWNLGLKIEINHFTFQNLKTKIRNAHNDLEWNQKWSQEVWETATLQVTPSTHEDFWIEANQDKYPIQLTFLVNVEVPTYIRNVKLMLLVIDG